VNKDDVIMTSPEVQHLLRQIVLESSQMCRTLRLTSAERFLSVPPDACAFSIERISTCFDMIQIRSSASLIPTGLAVLGPHVTNANRLFSASGHHLVMQSDAETLVRLKLGASMDAIRITAQQILANIEVRDRLLPQQPVRPLVSRLLRGLLQIIPAADRSRYRQEWLSEIHDFAADSRREQLRYAWRLARTSIATRRSLVEARAGRLARNRW
jgi:hypothetical protein